MATREAYAAELPHVAAERPKILIVDDNPANLTALRHLLAPLSAEIVEAQSGNEALGRILDGDIILILLDVNMPDMDGYEVANMVRGVDETKFIPIIFVTAAYRDELHRLRGYRAGAVDYIEKPINDEILLSKVQVFLDLYSSKLELERFNRHLEQRVEQRTAALQTANKELQRALVGRQEVERRLATLMSNLPGMAYRRRHDPSWSMAFVSYGALSLTGYSAADLAGESQPSYMDIIYYDDQHRVRGEVELAVADRRPYRLEYRISTRLGEIRWVWEQGRAIYGDDGAVIALEGFVTDITSLKMAEADLLRYQRDLEAMVEERTAELRAEIVERQKAELELQRWGQIFHHAEWGIVVGSAGGRTLELMNPAFARMHGYTVAELAGRPMADVFAPEKRYELPTLMAQAHEKGHVVWETLHCRKDGSVFPVLLDTTTVRGDDGSIQYRVMNCQDITDRKKAEQRVRGEQAFLQSVVNGVGDPILVIDLEHRVLLMNEAARAGAPKQTLLPEAGDVAEKTGQENEIGEDGDEQGKGAFVDAASRCYFVTHHRNTPCGGQDGPCPLQTVVETGQPTRVIHRHMHRDDGPRSYELLATPLWNADGSLRGIIEASRDITEYQTVLAALREKELRMDHLAHHDTLTGLPNRLLLLDRLEQAIHQARRNKEVFALMFIDLDRFKEINDSLGHATGDQLLVVTAERLVQSLRQEDVVARFGGDEFLVLVRSIMSQQTAALVADKLVAELRRPIAVDGNELVVTTSIGICLFPDHGEEAETLIRNADSAMYSAKEKGRNVYQFYDLSMTAQVMERVVMENGLRSALDRAELALYYQPQVNLETGSVSAVEALIRWKHDSMGLVMPDRFIGIAEESNLIFPVGRWVLTQACRQMVAWLEADNGLKRVAVNMSGVQLEHPAIVEQVRGILEETGCPPEALELEITENFIMHHPEESIETLNHLRSLGVEVSLDDFGTGYSSLSLLRWIPLTRLKIDQSFVRNVPHAEGDREIITAIIAMAKSLRLNVIAEGVETLDQRDFLVKHGCREGQGFLFSEPVPVDRLPLSFTQKFDEASDQTSDAAGA